MSNGELSLPQQIQQLNDARKHVLGDVKLYPGVVRGLIPSIGASAPLELRRWGADFLAEAFATPVLPNGEKETLAPYVLATLESLVQKPDEDHYVLRGVIQTAASIYPLALRWIINNSYDTVTWERMMAIKQRILQIWDTATPTVRICCIKFAQRVVLAQTVSIMGDHRYSGGLDISLDKIPPNHQTLDPRTLEAEASGLLDRMLSVLQDSNDALVVDATLNSLSILIRTRPETSNRIINAIFAFNPLNFAPSPLTPRSKVMIRSMEKTVRSLLVNLSRRDPHNPLVPRMQQHVERNMRMIAEAFDTSGKKRALEAAQHDGSDAKRQRITTAQIQIPPLGSGPHSLADLFSLVSNDGLKTFDLSLVPPAMVSKLVVTTLARLDTQLLAKAVDGVRDRLQTVANAPVAELNPNTAPLGVDDDDDDYEPDFYQAEDTEQILNKLDSEPSGLDPIHLDDNLALKSFSLSQPQQLTPELALTAGAGTVEKVVGMMKSLEDSSAKKVKAGFSRLAASSGTKDAWMTILARLATRSSAGLDEIFVKGEDDGDTWSQSLSNTIREVLYNYIMEDFRKHIDVAVSWLCEEWYNDRLLSKTNRDYPKYYEKCALRLLDGFLPYVHPQDKVLTRFLSEIPELNQEILSRVKQMCRDPLVVKLALTSLLYLVLMRPPVKELALDTVQDIWTEFEDARTMAGHYLSKYRPGFLEAAAATSARTLDSLDQVQLLNDDDGNIRKLTPASTGSINSMQTASRNIAAKHAIGRTATIRSVPSFDGSDSSHETKQSPFSSSTNSNTSAASTALAAPGYDKAASRSASSAAAADTHTTAAASRWSANGVRVIEQKQQPGPLTNDGSVLSEPTDGENGQWDSTIGKAGLGKTGRVINKLVSDNDALKREIQIERLRAEEAKQAAKLIEDKMERMVSEYEGRLLEASVTKTLLARKERQVETLTATVDVERRKAAAALESERTWKEAMQQARGDAKTQVEHAATHAQLVDGRYNAIASHWREQGEQVARAVTKMRTEIAEIVDERARDDDKIRTLLDLCEQQDGNIRELRREKEEIGRLFAQYKTTQDDDLRAIRTNAKKREDEQERMLAEAREALHKLKWALNVKNNVKGAQ
ncbi:hypothetical protein NHJ13734_000369 [Beauveria thailandica]